MNFINGIYHSKDKTFIYSGESFRIPRVNQFWVLISSPKVTVIKDIGTHRVTQRERNRGTIKEQVSRKQNLTIDVAFKLINEILFQSNFEKM